MKFVSFLFNNNVVVSPEICLETDNKIVHGPTSISKLPHFTTPQLDAGFRFSTQLQHFLQGKQLLLDELPFSIQQIQSHYLSGYLTYEQGITIQDQHYHCQRCGNEVQHLFASYPCARCQEQCIYCRGCIQTGRVSQCSPLVRWTGAMTPYEPRSDVLNWYGTLSQGQQTASEAIVNLIGNGGELLVWAVCGAGKTEVLFAGIEKALQQCLRVLIATPRKDVVLELAPRLKKVFPTTEMISLYGGSEDRNHQGQLVLATTHQLLKYKECFDLVIVDEVDAFPYNADPMLPFAVNKAKKKEATTIYLTATPEPAMKKRISKNELAVVKIPRRYHGHPLPVPTFAWAGNLQKSITKKHLPNNVINWLTEKHQRNEQVFLFVPTITLLEQIVPLLKSLSENIDGVHSEDPNRKEKVEKFRTGAIPILVTTTILERGVTVPRISVAVLAAEHQVYTESALVQIAGRVGRSADYPTGDVVFFHYGKTKAMVEAREHIASMNQL
ncbi:DEAD/DEAH box helicase [Anaerobacillus sp. MEB173]|uniref:DEAD/DEAH box helicase n=1 Tax=Anaerobacillus sp. MEB173 TaxID=3383345 RepID=UPI003F90A1D0